MIEIKIPFKTPTINHLYFVWKNRRILTKEARDLRIKIRDLVLEKYLPQQNGEKKLEVEVEVHEDWYTKRGLVKRKDISNREKFLMDSIFDSLEIDDKFIFKHTMTKVQSDKEFSIIRIKELLE